MATPSLSSSSPSSSSSASLAPGLLPVASASEAAFPALSFLFQCASPPVRLEMELEFVSLLSNPFYLHHLATSGFLSSQSFLTYLRYLRSTYTRAPYALLVQHPHALHFLHRLCDSAAFRAALQRRDYAELLHTQQYWTWRSHRYNRYRQHMEAKEKEKERSDRPPVQPQPQQPPLPPEHADRHMAGPSSADAAR